MHGLNNDVEYEKSNRPTHRSFGVTSLHHKLLIAKEVAANNCIIPNKRIVVPGTAIILHIIH